MQKPEQREASSQTPQEPELDIRKMAILFFNAMVFIKVPLLYFGFRMSEDPSPLNIAGFAFFLAFSLISLVWFVLR